MVATLIYGPLSLAVWDEAWPSARGEVGAQAVSGSDAPLSDSPSATATRDEASGGVRTVRPAPLVVDREDYTNWGRAVQRPIARKARRPLLTWDAPSPEGTFLPRSGKVADDGKKGEPLPPRLWHGGPFVCPDRGAQPPISSALFAFFWPPLFRGHLS